MLFSNMAWMAFEMPNFFLLKIKIAIVKESELAAP